MRYAVTVFLDCPQCGDEAEVSVAYAGEPSRQPYADSREVKYVVVGCPNLCALTCDEYVALEEEAIAIAGRSHVHAEMVR